MAIMKNRIPVILLLIGLALPLKLGQAQTLPSRYHRYTQMRSILASMQNSHPGIVKLDTMGFSMRWQIPMLRLKISSVANIEQDKPVSLIAGGVHANEVLGPEMVLGFIQDLLNKYDTGNQQAINLINSLEIYCVPFINPEGHVYVESGNFGWRKNQCDNDSNGVFNFHDGVDNNRNYDIGWVLANAPNAVTPESSMYRGTAPFTQSENIAMREFGIHYHPIVALDYHSPFYGLSEVTYYPWYWRITDGGQGNAPDEALMSSISNQFASLIVNDAGDSTYRSHRGLVEEGDFLAYYYGTFGTVSFTVELSDTTIQRGNLVDSIVARNLPSVYFILERALQGRITGVVRDSVTLEPLDAEVRVMEHTNSDIRPRLCRADFGRYDRILDPGSYTLRFSKSGYITKFVANVTVGSSPVINDILLVPLAPRPPAPTLLFPADNQILTDNQLVFDWSDVTLASKYLIEVSTDSSMQNLLISDSTLTSSAFPLFSPLSDGVYFWRVKGGNSNGWGPYALAQRFTIDAQSVYENPRQPTQFTLNQNYPNPFNSRTVISFQLNKASTIDLNIYSVQGELIASLAHNIFMSAGEHRFVWDGTDIRGMPLASGTYFYELVAAGQHRSRPMMMIK
jgi:hypothetical protein